MCRNALIWGLGCLVAAALLLAAPSLSSTAQADDGYWRNYWNWYDGTYRPYYNNYYNGYRGSYNYRPYGGGYYYGQPYGRYYGTPNYGYFNAPGPGGGVNIGPLQFRWR